jgi:non-specific serine/threonine protein kinase
LRRDDAVAEALAAGGSQPEEQRATPSAVAPSSLSRREQEVTLLLARGLTNRQIGAELGLASRTVDSHVGNILRKLGLASREQVRAWAIERELPPTDAH